MASGTQPWIGAIDIDDGGHWLAAGGGGRHVGMWHLSSRKFVAAMPTCGVVHALNFCGDKLVSGGAEPALYLWSRSGNPPSYSSDTGIYPSYYCCDARLHPSLL